LARKAGQSIATEIDGEADAKAASGQASASTKTGAILGNPRAVPIG
jgi:hypothetical protein